MSTSSPAASASRRPLLMIPGPIEVSPAVVAAAAGAPMSHVSPAIIASFGAALGDLRRVVLADAAAQPFVIAGSGTLAMEMAVANLVEAGDHAVVVNTGYFSDRIAEMLRRRGAEVTDVRAAIGDAPSLADVAAAMRSDTVVLVATHVDTSTGVRVDPAPLAALAAERGVLSVFDGVCATGGERFEMAAWGADVVLTASQKAIGLPVGLALLVASERAMRHRTGLRTEPPLVLDWLSWAPVMLAYEAGQPSYFATPATTLIPALQVGLRELLDLADAPADAMEAVFVRQHRVARAMRAAWATLGLELLPQRVALAADTLSALRYPPGVGPELVGQIAQRGVTVAGGLHPAAKATYFRVGHMGYTTTQPAWLETTVRAVGDALVACGHACDVERAVDALRDVLADAG